MSEMKSLTLNGETFDSFVDPIARELSEALAIISSASGENIVVSDSSSYRLPSLNVYGKTTQRKTTGVQLIPMPYKVTGTTAVGVTAEVKGDGGIKCTGTATSSAYFALYGGYAIDAVPIPNWLVEGETYTISGGTTKVGVAMFLYKEDGTAWQIVGLPQSTFVMPSGFSYIGIFVYCSAGTTASDTVYPMLNTGSTAADYEPYTGGKPAPSPDYPQDLVSPGDGGNIVVSVTGENDAQSMTIATPNGLPGIPVSSGGNYTDANGQQWICDEIDLARGVYVQRVAAETLSGTPKFTETEDYAGRFAHMGFFDSVYKFGQAKALSTFAKWIEWGLGKPGEDYFAMSRATLYFYPANTMTVDEVNTLFAEMIASETPPIVMAQLETPIETPLTEEELADYAALHTYRNNTTVSNDAGAYMELEYVMDAKKYIDSLVIGGGSSTTILKATVE